MGTQNGIGSLKGVEVATCGIKCVNLTVNAVKILGIYFHRIINLAWKKILNRNIKHSKRSQNWHMRNLTLDGKIRIFKTLALPKVVHLCLTSVAPEQITFGTDQLRKLRIVLYAIILQPVV